MSLQEVCVWSLLVRSKKIQTDVQRAYPSPTANNQQGFKDSKLSLEILVILNSKVDTTRWSNYHYHNVARCHSNCQWSYQACHPGFQLKFFGGPLS